MAYRLYLSNIVGDGQTPATAYRSRFCEIANPLGIQCYERIDKEKINAAWVIADISDPDHATMIADAGIRHIPKSVMVTKRADLTAGQLTAITEVLTHFGFAAYVGSIFTDQATVFDLMRWIFGGTYWDGYEDWMTNASD